MALTVTFAQQTVSSPFPSHLSSFNNLFSLLLKNKFLPEALTAPHLLTRTPSLP